MKACPNCQSTYEDWIEFCFNDGVPLVAYEPKAQPRVPDARPSAARAPQAASSSFDAPEARMVSGADLPEPGNLTRSSGAPPAAPTEAPERAPRATGISPTALPEPRGHGAPPVTAAPVPAAEGLDAPELAAPTPIASPLPERDDETTSTGMVPAAAPARIADAPPVEPAPAAAAQPRVDFADSVVPLPPTPSTGLDADALGDIAAAMKAPSPVSTAVTLPFHVPVRESEDGKATIPMYAPYPAEPAERSALDDEPPRKKGGAGMGVALIGLVALAAFALIAVIGIGWGVSQGGKEPVQAAPEQAKVTAPRALPAASEPAPVVPPVEEPAPIEPVDVPPPTPVAAAPVAPVAAPAATPTPVAKATPTRAPTTTNGASASTPKPSTAPPATRPVATPTSGEGTANVTSDSVWGTPTAPTSGFLRIVTDPDGATVYVNDAAKGKTPATIELPYGAHQVRVVRAGYKTEVRDVNIRVRELTVPFNLKPEVVTGQVNVYGPDGFRVVVDGHDMGPMPVTVQVSEGVRQFKLVGSDGNACNLPKEIKFKAAGRPETITLACP